MGASTIGSPVAWVAFTVIVLAFLAFDIGVLQRRSHSLSLKEAGLFSALWVGISIAFGFGVYSVAGSRTALEFASGYLLEKALAIDNLFVFAAIFGYFRLPARYQHRVLIWGLIGAMVLRAVFVATGAALLARFAWILYGFGALLLVLAVRMLRAPHDQADQEEPWLISKIQRFLPTTSELHGRKFWAREDGHWRATPLFLAMVAVEISDIVFALDSLPAVFAVTRDPFVVFTSNILAILGLRAMYFLLAGALGRLRYLRYALAAVLAFIAAKLLLKDLIELPVWATLAVTGALVGVAIGASLLIPPRSSGSGAASAAG